MAPGYTYSSSAVGKRQAAQSLPNMPLMAMSHLAGRAWEGQGTVGLNVTTGEHRHSASPPLYRGRHVSLAIFCAACNNLAAAQRARGGSAFCRLYFNRLSSTRRLPATLKLVTLYSLTRRGVSRRKVLGGAKAGGQASL